MGRSLCQALNGVEISQNDEKDRLRTFLESCWLLSQLKDCNYTGHNAKPSLSRFLSILSTIIIFTVINQNLS